MRRKWFMNSMETWKLLIDIGLMTSLVFLCYRFARPEAKSGSSARSEKLDTSLRLLIKEAEQASRDLDDKLLGRQRNLQRLLYDLEAMEERATRALSNGERAERDPIRPPSQAADKGSATDTYTRKRANEGYTARSHEAEQRYQPQEEPEQVPDSQEWQNTNIYGEPIPSAQPVRETPKINRRAREAGQNLQPQGRVTGSGYRPLAASVEREVVKPAPVKVVPEDPEVNASLQEIYSAAEQMLKAGKDVAFICEHTRLPVDEVKMLSQILERESGMQTPDALPERSKQDSRLGVLGGIKREVQVL